VFTRSNGKRPPFRVKVEHWPQEKGKRAEGQKKKEWFLGPQGKQMDVKAGSAQRGRVKFLPSRWKPRWLEGKKRGSEALPLRKERRAKDSAFCQPTVDDDGKFLRLEGRVYEGANEPFRPRD